MIKVFLVDEHPVIRKGISVVLEEFAEFKVVGEANNIEEAISQIGELKPDLVIMDAFRGVGDNIENIAMIQQKYDKAKVFILTASTREQDFLEALGAGVRGYLSKVSEVSELLDAVRLVAADGTVVYSSKVASIFDSTIKQANQSGLLSTREKEILGLVAHGLSNKEIADRCYVSEATVKAHLRRITEKMNVKNRAEAVATGIERGFIEIGRNSSDT